MEPVNEKFAQFMAWNSTYNLCQIQIPPHLMKKTMLVPGSMYIFEKAKFAYYHAVYALFCDEKILEFSEIGSISVSAEKLNPTYDYGQRVLMNICSNIIKYHRTKKENEYQSDLKYKAAHRFESVRDLFAQSVPQTKDKVNVLCEVFLHTAHQTNAGKPCYVLRCDAEHQLFECIQWNTYEKKQFAEVVKKNGEMIMLINVQWVHPKGVNRNRFFVLNQNSYIIHDFCTEWLHVVNGIDTKFPVGEVGYLWGGKRAHKSKEYCFGQLDLTRIADYDGALAQLKEDKPILYNLSAKNILHHELGTPVFKYKCTICQTVRWGIDTPCHPVESFWYEHKIKMKWNEPNGEVLEKHVVLNDKAITTILGYLSKIQNISDEVYLQYEKMYRRILYREHQLKSDKEVAYYNPAIVTFFDRIKYDECTICILMKTRNNYISLTLHSLEQVSFQPQQPPLKKFKKN